MTALENGLFDSGEHYDNLSTPEKSYSPLAAEPAGEADGKSSKDLEAENRFLRQSLIRLARDNEMLVRKYRELATILEADV